MTPHVLIRDYKELVRYLYLLRKRQRISRRVLADRTKFSQSSIKLWEQHQQFPSIDKLLVWLQTLGGEARFLVPELLDKIPKRRSRGTSKRLPQTPTRRPVEIEEELPEETPKTNGSGRKIEIRTTRIGMGLLQPRFRLSKAVPKPHQRR